MHSTPCLPATAGAIRASEEGRFFTDDTTIASRRVKEWRVTLGIPLAVSAVSSFVPV